MKREKYLRREWRVMSELFVQHHGLPEGTKIVLMHEPARKRGKARQARSDMTISHRPFRRRVHDEETVKELFEDHLLPFLTVDPRKKGLRLQLVGPQGQVVERNNMRIKTVRAWEPNEPPSASWRQEMRQILIDEVSEIADVEIRHAEERQSDLDVVSRGYVRALVQRYGRTAVEAAVAGEDEED